MRSSPLLLALQVPHSLLALPGTTHRLLHAVTSGVILLGVLPLRGWRNRADMCLLVRGVVHVLLLGHGLLAGVGALHVLLGHLGVLRGHVGAALAELLSALVVLLGALAQVHLAQLLRLGLLNDVVPLWLLLVLMLVLGVLLLLLLLLLLLGVLVMLVLHAAGIEPRLLRLAVKVLLTALVALEGLLDGLLAVVLVVGLLALLLLLLGLLNGLLRLLPRLAKTSEGLAPACKAQAVRTHGLLALPHLPWVAPECICMISSLADTAVVMPHLGHAAMSHPGAMSHHAHLQSYRLVRQLKPPCSGCRNSSLAAQGRVSCKESG